MIRDLGNYISASGHILLNDGSRNIQESNLVVIDTHTNRPSRVCRYSSAWIDYIVLGNQSRLILWLRVPLQDWALYDMNNGGKPSGDVGTDRIYSIL